LPVSLETQRESADAVIQSAFGMRDARLDAVADRVDADQAAAP
jgi:hypothetical protein